MVRSSFKIDYKCPIESTSDRVVVIEGSTYEDGSEATVDVHDVWGNTVFLPVSIIPEILMCIKTVSDEQRQVQ